MTFVKNRVLSMESECHRWETGDIRNGQKKVLTCYFILGGKEEQT